MPPRPMGNKTRRHLMLMCTPRRHINNNHTSSLVLAATVQPYVPTVLAPAATIPTPSICSGAIVLPPFAPPQQPPRQDHARPQPPGGAVRRGATRIVVVLCHHGGKEYIIRFEKRKDTLPMNVGGIMVMMMMMTHQRKTRTLMG